MKFLAFAGFIGKLVGDVHEKDDNQKQRSGYLSISIYGDKISHSERYFSILTVMSKKIIPKPTFLINNKIVTIVSKFAKLGAINATPNQIPEMFIDRAESALSQYLGIFSTSVSLIRGQLSVNQIFAIGAAG